MTDRLVTENRKSFNGNIIALYNPDESWSPRFKHDAIRDIESNIHSYFMVVNGQQKNIKVVLINGSKQLVYDSEKL
jgi:hypothetical protein